MNLEGLLTTAEFLFGLFGVTLGGLLSWLTARYFESRRKTRRFNDRKRLGLDYPSLRAAAIESGLLTEGQAQSLHKLHQTQADLLFNKILEWQTRQIAQARSTYVSGSRTFTLGELLENPELCMPVKARMERGEAVPLNELFDSLLSTSKDAHQQKWAIVGDAGSGKSFFCDWLADRANSETSDSLLVVIRPEDIEPILESGEDAFTSRSVAQLLARRISISPTKFDLLVLEQLIESRSLLVVDGLDEIVARLPDSQRLTALRSWLFSSAKILTTRFWHYQYLLDRSKLFLHREVATLVRLEQQDAESFLSTALRLVCPGATEAQVRLSRSLDLLARLAAGGADKAPGLDRKIEQKEPKAVAGLSPLLVMMLIEVAQEADASEKLEYSVDIYRYFVDHMLLRELKREATSRQESVARSFLQDLAWRAFVGGGDSPALSVVEVEQRVRDAVKQGQTNTLVLNKITRDSAFCRTRDELVRFSHQSFVEYFAAERLYDWVLGKRKEGGDFFEQLETPQITVFIKEFLDKILQTEVLARTAADTLTDHLETELSLRDAATTEYERRQGTFRIGQVVYHLAFFETPNSPIIQRALADESLWVQQAAAIGLAFGGSPGPLNDYLDGIRDEISRGDFRKAGAHIATQLSFYGDQEFDPLDPTRDSGTRSCRKLLTRVVHELWLSAEAANWRVNLFDIVFLSKYRPQSEESFLRALNQVKDSLAAVLPLLEKQHGSDLYPEFAEVRGLLDAHLLEQ